MFKVKNDIFPNVLDEFITKRDLSYNLRNPLEFQGDEVSTTRYGTESIRILGPRIWHIIPNDIKESEILNSFKAKIKKWKVETCPCRLCKTFVRGLGFL